MMLSLAWCIFALGPRRTQCICTGDHDYLPLVRSWDKVETREVAFSRTVATVIFAKALKNETGRERGWTNKQCKFSTHRRDATYGAHHRPAMTR